MEVLDLKLINYRNFSDQHFSFNPEGALLFGKNGIGKTNLLEAISYFAFGKSFRNNKDLDLINFPKAFFRLEAVFRLAGKEMIFEAAAEKNKKILRVNGFTVSKISDLYKYVKVIYFSPDDINMIALSPSFRRGFLNIALSQYSFQYMQELRDYFKILKQRNALLKTDFTQKEKKSWDRQFIDKAIFILNARISYLKKFTPLLKEFYARVSSKEEKLDLNYKFSFPTSKQDLRSDLEEQLDRISEQEKEQQRSLLGPHLDDIDFLINGHSARKFGSQGQMRSIAISAKLVQAELITANNKETPIIMFDDVLADLDKTRSQKIIELLKKEHQIFIATPNKDIYKQFALDEIDVGKFI